MVSFGGAEVPKSPFEVNVGSFKETAIRAYGPGLVGGVVAHPALFTVETNGEAGDLGECLCSSYCSFKGAMTGNQVTSYQSGYSSRTWRAPGSLYV